jgi:putative inorganic carbon (HCO3(-)) transporter
MRQQPRVRGGLAWWIAVGTAGIILGLLTVRVATAHSKGGMLMLAAALAPFALALVRDLRKLLLLVVVLDIAFQWDKNYGYQLAPAALGAQGGLNVSVTTIALVGLYAMWGAELLARRAAVPRGLFAATLPMLAYVGLTGLSTMVATDRALSYFEVALLVQTLLMFVYVVGTVRTREDVVFLAAALVTCLLAEAVVTLSVPIVGAHNLIGIKTSIDPGAAGSFGSRFAGTLSQPNSTGAFFSLLIVPAIALIAMPVSRRLKRFAVVAAALGIIALVLTFSRGGWIAFALSSTFFIAVGLKRGWISARIPIASAIVLVLLLVPLGGQIATRITGSDNGAAAGRMPLIHLAVSVIGDHPVLGVGANNLAVAFPKYAGPKYSGDWIYTVHNKYLLVWAESGIGALLAFLWFLFATIRRGWNVWRTSDKLLAPLALGLTAALIGRMAHMSVDTFQDRPHVQSLALIAAIIAAMDLISSRVPDIATANRAPSDDALAPLEG